MAHHGNHESTFAFFWEEVGSRLPTADVVYTTNDNWIKPAEANLLLQHEEADAVHVLEGLGIKVVHESLRQYQNILRSEPLSIAVLSIEKVCTALMSLGLNRRVNLDELPVCLKSPADREALWNEITHLLGRQQRNPRAKNEDERRLRGVAIAPGRDGALWPCGAIYAADDETTALFETLDLNIPFLSSCPGFAPLQTLCRLFESTDAVDALDSVGSGHLEELWNKKKLSLAALFGWFENRRQQILADDVTRQKLTALELYPSSGRLRSLSKLALSGNFSDPLALADLVDVPAVGGRREFLKALGIRELDFRTYALSYVPAALRDSTLTVNKRRELLLLLASRIGELRDDEEVRKALADAPLVECTDGHFRESHHCYFDDEAVRECLGNTAHVAVRPTAHRAAAHDLFIWLGVAHQPRLADIVARVLALAGQAYSDHVVVTIQAILAHLGKRINAGDDPVELRPLRGMCWLPARDKADRWYAPTELYAAYQSYLFASQALFLNAPASLPASLLGFLGVRSTPDVSMVVKHLLFCAERQIPVNTEVYRFLNDNAEDPSVAQLKDTRCLFLGDGYRLPNEVFWLDHPFGRYRWRLAEELRGYASLLKRLDVHETPDRDDGMRVLKEISSEFGRSNDKVDEHAHVVLMTCWRMLDEGLENDPHVAAIVAGLRAVKCIPRHDWMLQPPEWMFFENRAGLAAKFGGFLTNNVITRPLGAANAFAAAGVRPLGTAVETELLECVDPADEAHVAENIRARRNEIARVLESQVQGQSVAEALSRLDRMKCQVSTSLSIRYRLNAFNNELHSKLEDVPALYDRERGLLLFVRRDGRMHWSAIAREVAIASFPEEDPGRFAAGLKEVLAARDANEAAAALDELGFARLDTDVQKAPSDGGVVKTLGTPNFPDGDATPVQSPSDMVFLEKTQGLRREEAIESILGKDAPSPSPPPTEPGSEPPVPIGAGGRRRSAEKHSRPVLRTYVPSPGNDDGEPQSDDDNEPSRSQIDEAGVRRVVEYETTCGRKPCEMPHKNPGYDIESRDASGCIVRYIEVKSFSGRWHNTYADLSRPQFVKANGLGDAFWLYVVECAESQNFRIYRIQNPACRANHFMFDDGWRVLSEPSSS
jgi:hypothetical protein